MSALSRLLHELRDGLLVAISALERGDEVGAFEELERIASRTREGLEELRVA